MSRDIRVGAGSLAGAVWFGGWLFTIGYLKLTFWAGALALLIWPYDIGKFSVKPPAEAVWAAYDQRGKVDLNYHRIDTVTGSALLKVMKQALTAGYLFNFGTPVTEDFCSGNVGGSPDHAAFPPVDGKGIAGGHSMTACGYDDTLALPVFKIANSWGKDFGDNGFCYFDESYMTWYETSDMWICTLAPRFSGGAL